jgi:hypothetical protein
MIQALPRRGHFADTRLQVSHNQPLVKERRVDYQKEEKRAAQNCVCGARKKNPLFAHVIVFFNQLLNRGLLPPAKSWQSPNVSAARLVEMPFLWKVSV